MNKLLLITVTAFVIVSMWIISELPPPPMNQPADKIRAEAPVAYDQQEPMPGVWYSVVMNVSAYCGCEKCCGTGSPRITASGSRIGDVSHFIAAPPEYPFGTVMRVPGYCETPVVVLDRGGSIKGDRLDVFIYDPKLTDKQNHQVARKFGRQENLTVEIWKGTAK